MPSKDGLAYASSVTYTAAAGESPATLVAAGFPSPKGGLAPYAIVSFESTAFGLMATGQIALTGVISMGPSSPVESSAFNTVPVITVTVQPSEEGAFPMPTAASDYALTFKSDGSSAIFTPNSDQVKITQGKAATEEPPAAAVKAQAVITVPQSFALGNLSSGTAYSVTMAGWSSDGNDYTAAAGSLTYNLGSNLNVSMAASQIEYGSISITLPESFQSKAILGEDNLPKTINMSDVGTVSYAIKSSDGKEYSGTVSETAVKVPYGTYDVSISFSYGEIAFAAAASASVTVSSSEATTATIQDDAVQAQVADITVSFGTVGAPSSWPTLASAYAVTYAEIKDGEAGAPVGYPVKNALTGAQFTIASSGLKVGSAYEVSVSFAGSDQDYRAVGTTGALASIDSSSAQTANAVTAYFGAPVTATVSGTAALSGFSGLSGTGYASTDLAVGSASISTSNITAKINGNNIEFGGSVTGAPEAITAAASALSISGTISNEAGAVFSVSGTLTASYSAGSGSPTLSITAVTSPSVQTLIYAVTSVVSTALDISSGVDNWGVPTQQATLTITAPSGVKSKTLTATLATDGKITIAGTGITGSEDDLKSAWSLSGAWEDSSSNKYALSGTVTPTFASGTGILTFSAATGLKIDKTDAE